MPGPGLTPRHAAPVPAGLFPQWDALRCRPRQQGSPLEGKGRLLPGLPLLGCLTWKNQKMGFYGLQTKGRPIWGCEGHHSCRSRTRSRTPELGPRVRGTCRTDGVGGEDGPASCRGPKGRAHPADAFPQAGRGSGPGSKPALSATSWWWALDQISYLGDSVIPSIKWG